MGLDTLDEFSPKDTDPVSLGDDAIRLTRAATKQSVGLEHYLDGAHKIPGGTQALRPAAGRAGRIYYNTDVKVIEYDNGTSWMSIADAKARATILWHGADVAIASGQTLEIPFDTVIDDPWNYALLSAHQIQMPTNSMGMVTAYVSLDTAVGGYGGILAIEQWDYTYGWRPLAQAWNNTVQFYNVATMADSRWGRELRVTFLNAGPSTRWVKALAIGSSPRFGFAMIGRTS